MRYVVRTDGVEFTWDDLTLAEWGRIEKATGVPWYDVHPLHHALHAHPVLVEALARAGVSRLEAQKRVDAMTSSEVLDRIKLEPYEDDDRPSEYQDGVPVIDPKAAPAASVTTGS